MVDCVIPDQEMIVLNYVPHLLRNLYINDFKNVLFKGSK